jgi:hypothetical protein
MPKLRFFLLFVVCVSTGCADHDEKAPPPPQRAAGGTPTGTTCVARGADSASIAEAAFMAAVAAHQDWTNAQQMHVTGFERHRDGTRVTLMPGTPNRVGGGGIVWIPDGGCAEVRELFE